jgi:hypothetical protein
MIEQFDVKTGRCRMTGDIEVTGSNENRSIPTYRSYLVEEFSIIGIVQH